MRIHQFHFAFIPGDAISNQMIEIDKRLREWGFEASIFAQHIDPALASQASPENEFLDCIRDPDDLLIYHYGLYSPSVRYFLASRGRRVLVYHNITPGHYFRGWSREQELLCDVGRRTLPILCDCDLALADSEFNRQELVTAGFAKERTAVLPIFLSQARLDAFPADHELLSRLRGTGTVNFLSVGRVVPNKAIEDVIRVFSIYHQAINANSRLYIVGSRYLPAYDAALDKLVAELGLEQSVVFTGLVTDGLLKTYYQAADLFLTASYHEGFCVPLLESMYFGVPILARKSAAIPETLGEAGVLFTALGYEEVAEMAHLLVSDAQLRAQVITQQRARLHDLGPSSAEARLDAILSRLQLVRRLETQPNE